VTGHDHSFFKSAGERKTINLLAKDQKTQDHCSKSRKHRAAQKIIGEGARHCLGLGANGQDKGSQVNEAEGSRGHFKENPGGRTDRRKRWWRQNI